MMVRQPSQLCALLLLALVALQQGCAPKTPLQVPPAQPSEEIAAAEPPAEPALKQEMPAQLPPKLPELSLEASKKERLPESAVARPEASKKERLPESVVARPEKESASPSINYNTVLLTRASGTAIDSQWQYRVNRHGQVVGFEFSNTGGNRILPERYDVKKNLLFSRDFQFRFDDRARQDIHLSISDWAPSRDGQFRLSELMNSVMYFFPRHYVPAITRWGERVIVTLPTGEEVEFDGRTHEIRGGVISEEPVDLNPDKRSRKFPGINYIGQGVVVRANSQGADPRLGTVATIISRSAASGCEGAGCHQCHVPSKELWEQNGAVRFKFSTDTEFETYLLSRCGFGLPTIGLREEP
jgi:hypothetical protein